MIAYSSSDSKYYIVAASRLSFIATVSFLACKISDFKWLNIVLYFSWVEVLLKEFVESEQKKL